MHAHFRPSYTYVTIWKTLTEKQKTYEFPAWSTVPDIWYGTLYNYTHRICHVCSYGPEKHPEVQKHFGAQYFFKNVVSRRKITRNIPLRLSKTTSVGSETTAKSPGRKETAATAEAASFQEILFEP